MVSWRYCSQETCYLGRQRRVVRAKQRRRAPRHLDRHASDLGYQANINYKGPTSRSSMPIVYCRPVPSIDDPHPYKRGKRPSSTPPVHEIVPCPLEIRFFLQHYSDTWYVLMIPFVITSVSLRKWKHFLKHVRNFWWIL